MLHTVAPVAREFGVEQLVFLGRDGVAELAGIAHRDFLIPALLAGHLLAFEGIEAADGDVQVGHGQGDGGVAHVLVEVHGGTQGHADAGEGGGHAHR